MEGQVLLLVLGLEWSCVALTDEALVGGANRLFPPLFNSGLMDFWSWWMVLQDGSLLEILGSDSKDPSGKS